MNYTSYAKILNSVEKKAPLESGVQALIYMFILERIKDKNLDVVIIDKMRNHSVFMSYGGISDIAIVENEFNYHGSGREKIRMCIEVKATNKNINNTNKTQVKKQLLTYNKAIITNGKDWIFYDLNNSLINIDKEKINIVIEQERKLAKKKWELKGLFQIRTTLVKNSKETEEVDKEIECKNKVITELKKEICEKRKEIDSQINYGSIQPMEDDCFKIDNENGFRSLCDKISEFIV